jgi:HprK-related kinase A
MHRMLTVSSLSRAELGSRLAHDGIHLQTGSFIVHLRTTVKAVADGIHLLYADYPLHEQVPFSDFHIRMARPRNPRRWYRPQVNFLFDEKALFRPLPLGHAFPMWEWGLNWALANKAHSYLILHAAVVEKDGFAAILPAPPGSGKSTLCAALVHNGWRLLSDELAMIRLADGLLLPLPRPISLKNASIDIIRNYVPGTVFSPAVNDTSKGTVAHLKPPADSIRRCAETAKPAWVVFPKYQAGSAPELTAMAPARAFIQLATNGFNYGALGPKGFDAMAGIVDTANCYTFTYSQLDDAIDVFSKLIPPAS